MIKYYITDNKDRYIDLEELDRAIELRESYIPSYENGNQDGCSVLLRDLMKDDLLKNKFKDYDKYQIGQKQFKHCFQFPAKLLTPINKHDNCPMTKIAHYLKHALDINDGLLEVKLDVTKMWISRVTEQMLDVVVLEYLKKQCGSVKEAKKSLGWYQLNYYPAVDVECKYGLKNGYIYLEPDFIYKGN